jgi:hypothetical protein
MDMWMPLSTIYWDENYPITDSNTILAMKDRNIWTMNSLTPAQWRGFIYWDMFQDLDRTYKVAELRALHENPPTPSMLGGGIPMMIDITHGTFTPTEFTVEDEDGNTLNNTCLQNAQTLEEVKACIDNLLNGTDPQNPNPPTSNYPSDGTGQLTRFNTRFWIWVIGWVCVWSPLFAMAYRRFPLQYYPMLVMTIIAGLGLLWSIGTI